MPKLLLDNTERRGNKARLPDFPPMGIGIQAVIAHHDLALVGDMGCHPGDEFQIVHHLLLGAVLSMPEADLALLLQEKEALQGQERPDHVFAHPLGLALGLGPHPAVDREAGRLA